MPCNDCDSYIDDRNEKIDELEYKLDILRRALKKIAACRGYITGDVVKMAQDALSEEAGK